MSTRNTLVVAALVLSASTCGGSSPNPAAPSTGTRWTVSGTVRATGGQPLDAARVAVLDGPNAGRSATTGADGRYTLAGLEPGGFTLATERAGYQPATQPVTLAGHQTADVVLLPLPARIVHASGTSLEGINCTATGCQFSGTLTNTGEGCAVQVRGTVEFPAVGSVASLTGTWTLNPSQLVRPSEIVAYTSEQEIPWQVWTTATSSPGAIFRATWTDTACPEWVDPTVS